MMWVARVNGNGRAFQQWQRTVETETMPAWGPGETFEACVVCGERYERRYMTIDGAWHEGERWMIYHDPVMHREYKHVGVPDLHVMPPRETHYD